MSESDKSNGANGAKAFGGLAAVAALATFAWMLWQAQSSRTETLERLTNQRMDLIDERVQNMHSHMGLEAHSVAKEWHTQVRNEIGTIQGMMRDDNEEDHKTTAHMERQREALREVETQFAHMDRLIQLLWQRVYEEPLPNPPPK
tara:strand:+ start:233 stop:667 length:435 start_codon:yes stop_codon:yes gene_type:complete